MPISDQLLTYLGPLAVAGALVALNFLRTKNSSPFPLRPNCLISRYPLVFVSGIRSPFYFLRFWNQVPRYLYEHGYIVEEWNLPWRNDQARKENLMERLTASRTPVHLFFDGSEREQWQEVIKKYSEKIASVTFIAKNADFSDHPPDVFELGLSAGRSSRSLSSLLSKLSLSAHQLWIGAPASAGEHGLGLPGFVTELHYQEYLQHAVHLAEGDFLR